MAGVVGQLRFTLLLGFAVPSPSGLGRHFSRCLERLSPRGTCRSSYPFPVAQGAYPWNRASPSTQHCSSFLQSLGSSFLPHV